MRIQKLKNKIPRRIILATIILLPIAFGGVYLGVYFGIMVPDLTSFMEVAPDTDEFYNLADINISRLEEIGTEFEHLQHEHIPLNISQTITKNATTGDVVLYHFTDNGQLHTIENLVASCLRYATLPAGAEKDYSLYLIRRMVDAMRLFIEVPNGGLGPTFPGEIVARFYAPPDRWNDGNYSEIFSDESYRHFNGTNGKLIDASGTDYSQWRMRLYTSKDELAAYFGGLAALLTLVPEPDIQNITKQIILQLMEGMLSSFWQHMGGVEDPGKPDGVHFQPPSSFVWKLLLTKLAMIVEPTNQKYRQLHHYYLAKERKVENVFVVGPTDSIDNYYSHYFNSFVLLGLFLVEDDQDILNLYFKNFHEKTYTNYRGHRNAMLNALYLAGAARTTRTTHYDLDSIRWDVLDQLWRFSERGLVPFDTTIGGYNSTINRTSLGAEWTVIDPNIAKWKNFVDNTWFGGLYKWLVYGLQDAIFDDRFLKPATVDMMRPKETIWNQNPYKEDGVHVYDTTNYITQYAGASFTLPYYILRYFGYVEVA
ncbi:MAG: hypothetical protein EU530_06270 [Promethearchaeota archaeon]|nr:MAG: hypothetical protein EU530_06270 [Candidatus Lokiarchaeota archaeon]